MATKQPPKSATLPPRVAPPRQTKPGASPSTARGFLGRIKRKLRFKNQDCEYDFGEPIHVQGVYFRRKSGEFGNGKEGGGTEQGNYSGRVEVTRSMSERSTTKPGSKLSKFRIGIRSSKSVKGSCNDGDVQEAKKYSQDLPSMALPLGSDLQIQNNYLTSDENAIDLEQEPKLSVNASTDEMDPGYETLDEVREKLRNLRKSNTRQTGQEDFSDIQYVTELGHKRSFSHGTPQIVFQDQRIVNTSSDNGLSMLPAGNQMETNACSSPQLYEECYSRGQDNLRNQSNHRRCHSDRFQLPPETLLTTRAGSCPIGQGHICNHVNSYHDNLSVSSISNKGSGTIWKETGDDIYANPNIVPKRSIEFDSEIGKGKTQGSDWTPEDFAPPIPDRKYSQGSIKDLVCEDLKADSATNKQNLRQSHIHALENGGVSQQTRCLVNRMVLSDDKVTKGGYGMKQRPYIYESIDDCKKEVRENVEDQYTDNDYDDAWGSWDSSKFESIEEFSNVVCKGLHVASPAIYESVDDSKRKDKMESRNLKTVSVCEDLESGSTLLGKCHCHDGVEFREGERNFSDENLHLNHSSDDFNACNRPIVGGSMDNSHSNSNSFPKDGNTSRVDKPKNVWKFKSENLYAEIDDLENEAEIRKSREITPQTAGMSGAAKPTAQTLSSNGCSETSQCNCEHEHKFEQKVEHISDSKDFQTDQASEHKLEQGSRSEVSDSSSLDTGGCTCIFGSLTLSNSELYDENETAEDNIDFTCRETMSFLSNPSSEIKLKKTDEDTAALCDNVTAILNNESHISSSITDPSSLLTISIKPGRSDSTITENTDLQTHQRLRETASLGFEVSDESYHGNISTRELHICTEDENETISLPKMPTPTSSSTMYYGGMEASLELPKGEEFQSAESHYSAEKCSLPEASFSQLTKVKPMSTLANQGLFDDFGMLYRDRDFESSIGSSNTDDSLDMMGMVRDTGISYEDSADSVLENLSSQHDGISEDFSSTENLLECGTDDDAPTSSKKSEKLKLDCANEVGTSKSEDFNVDECGIQSMGNGDDKNLLQNYDSANLKDTGPNFASREVFIHDGAEEEHTQLKSASDEKVLEEGILEGTEGAMASISHQRLPDYYYDDDEPIHMSISELNSSMRQTKRSKSAMKKSVSCLVGNSGSQSAEKERRKNVKSTIDERAPAIIPRTKTEVETEWRKDFWESMRQLKDCGWYWGPLSWDEAEIKLANKPDGSFLVRDSSNDRYLLSLSFNTNGAVHHTRIEHHKGKFSFWSQPDSLGKATIQEFIEKCVRNSQNGQFLYFIRPSGPGAPPIAVHLLYPVSRFKQMQSLQHICRFNIVQRVRRDHIDRLPIPTRIKQYLKESQYYVEYLED